MCLDLIERDKLRHFSGAGPKSFWGNLTAVEADRFRGKRLHPKSKVYLILYYKWKHYKLKISNSTTPETEFNRIWGCCISGHLSSMNSAPCLICLNPTDLIHFCCLPHAQLPDITAQPLRSAIEACYCMLIATCVVSRAKAAWVHVVFFYSLWTTVSFFLSFPSAVPHASRFSLSFSQMRNVVITEQMNLLMPKLDLWEGDIGDVRQCFTRVRVYLVQITQHL